LEFNEDILIKNFTRVSKTNFIRFWGLCSYSMRHASALDASKSARVWT